MNNLARFYPYQPSANTIKADGLAFHLALKKHRKQAPLGKQNRQYANDLAAVLHCWPNFNTMYTCQQKRQWLDGQPLKPIAALSTAVKSQLMTLRREHLRTYLLSEGFSAGIADDIIVNACTRRPYLVKWFESKVGQDKIDVNALPLNAWNQQTLIYGHVDGLWPNLVTHGAPSNFTEKGIFVLTQTHADALLAATPNVLTYVLGGTSTAQSDCHPSVAFSAFLMESIESAHQLLLMQLASTRDEHDNKEACDWNDRATALVDALFSAFKYLCAYDETLPMLLRRLQFTLGFDAILSLAFSPEHDPEASASLRAILASPSFDITQAFTQKDDPKYWAVCEERMAYLLMQFSELYHAQLEPASLGATNNSCGLAPGASLPSVLPELSYALTQRRLIYILPDELYHHRLIPVEWLMSRILTLITPCRSMKNMPLVFECAEHYMGKIGVLPTIARAANMPLFIQFNRYDRSCETQCALEANCANRLLGKIEDAHVHGVDLSRTMEHAQRLSEMLRTGQHPDEVSIDERDLTEVKAHMLASHKGDRALFYAYWGDQKHSHYTLLNTQTM
jgi:hypothetical protein